MRVRGSVLGPYGIEAILTARAEISFRLVGVIERSKKI